MDLKAVPTPGSKRFFKLSELAGKRWPNVTEEDIFNWHDAGTKETCGLVSVDLDIEGCIVERTACDEWDNPPHNGLINLLSFWVFFPDFCSIRPKNTKKEEIAKEDFVFDAATMQRMIDDLTEAAGAPFLYDYFENQYFMLGFGTVHGLAHNNENEIGILEFFDESGKLHFAGVGKEGSFPTLGEMKITKEDLLVKTSSVLLLEQIAPEITTTGFGGSQETKIFSNIEPKQRDNFQSEEDCLTKNVSEINEILNKNHPWHSPKLAMAVEAWIALYANHEGKKDLNEFKPYGGHIKMIKDWLQISKKRTCSGAERDHIANVVNPAPGSGPGGCKPWHTKPE